MAQADPDEFDVVVVCNGCVDGTAAIARSFEPAVEVIETPVGSKPHALNLGDAAARAFPRIYLDADVELSTADARNLVAGLARSDCGAATPTLDLNVAAAPWLVRSYLRIWIRLPGIVDGIVGRGAYILSEQGRRRFDAFPDVVADDQFVQRLFPPADRVLVCTSRSVVAAPATLRGLIRRKSRVFAGNRSLPAGSADAGPAQCGQTRWLRVVREQPILIWDVPAYVGITMAAKLRANVQRWRGMSGWERHRVVARD